MAGHLGEKTTYAMIDSKTAGRFGEHLVQAELERRGWSTCNLNADHPNAPGYDILAWKEESNDNDQSRTLSRNQIYVRVKTSRPLDRPNRRHFVFNVEKKGKPPSVDGIEPNDFTVLVGMGQERNADEFYIVPTRILRKEMYDRWQYYYGESTKKGAKKIESGMLNLYFHPAPKGENRRPGYDLANKWMRYRNNWELT